MPRPSVKLLAAVAAGVVVYALVHIGFVTFTAVNTKTKQAVLARRKFELQAAGDSDVPSGDVEKLREIARVLGYPKVSVQGDTISQKLLIMVKLLEEYQTLGSSEQVAKDYLHKIEVIIHSENLPPQQQDKKTTVNLSEGISIETDEERIKKEQKDAEDKKKEQPADTKDKKEEKKEDVKEKKEESEDLKMALSKLRPPKDELPALPRKSPPLKEATFTKDWEFTPSNCVTTIMDKVEDSEWFGERYMENIKVFLDSEDVNSAEQFNKLQLYGLPFGFRAQKREVLARLLNNKNFTNSPVFHGERRECIRCAVVGAGGSLNGSALGKEIDGHDYVFRLNRALTGGKYSKDIGNKTDFYTFFPESSYGHQLKTKDNVTFIFASFKQYDIDQAIAMVEGTDMPDFCTKKGGCRKLRNPHIPANQLKLLHPDFIRYVHARFLNATGSRPTTGAMVTFIAIQLCDEVNTYGFGYDPRFTIHYYDNKFTVHTAKSTGSHNIDNERALWKLLDNVGVVTWHRRDEKR
ncbi:PREDICTED: CMP-N-acetylneuraminate-beta-galactosamide-alpha-2,3-sialyltransferase 2-like [Branchiostoma belcheri]|uniref:alpha-N-acetylgalactosaminide alpha-2,6-sialyltransferase n=1 Tax=Branchiostoma belcheri TaxID=7741 RepID=A0A6P4XRV0_BRABE|nr:PREDICTED: CMP-N-acetylneuraminate-beta-galactosamide-alpha-2,3-sialyltransferase 2-like [Branchiostoma belcheri]XP_019613444.1 PREDICTED: CMP-N-acetylneuraminate-beta-galactosamide-alpha-2,3-sialyltransferase 2-like [Branchiostoma belcheri]XP_019613445.1 PREDICTED: CMP-N-acetylneuraminate-beta-galactosamide-alpha-2,3-sialyltransferase 2-like [Branchiostoma belcheri]XP_019613446.1 PREDICTED: CMP-N-acetylneuraminate-beta-galactosamide-alpha-2,3-sialyltransferase 2-like [Branchiostoma belcheri]